MAADLRRHLQNHEPIGPGRKPTLPAKRRQLRRDRDNSVGGGLIGEIVHFRARDPQRTSTTAQLVARHPQQQLVQP